MTERIDKNRPKCPGCGERHDWRYGEDMEVKGVGKVKVVLCDRVRRDRWFLTRGWDQG